MGSKVKNRQENRRYNKDWKNGLRRDSIGILVRQSPVRILRQEGNKHKNAIFPFFRFQKVYEIFEFKIDSNLNLLTATHPSVYPLSLFFFFFHRYMKKRFHNIRIYSGRRERTDKIYRIIFFGD